MAEPTQFPYYSFRNFGALGCVSLGLVLALPQPVHAHLRWFVEENPPRATHQWDFWYALVLLGVITSFISLIFLQSWLRSREGSYLAKVHELRPEKTFLKRMEYFLPLILRLFVGSQLFISGLNGEFLAPNLLVSEVPFGQALAMMEMLIGGMLFFGFYANWAAAALILYFLSGFLLYPTSFMLDYVCTLGIAFYLLHDGSRHEPGYFRKNGALHWIYSHRVGLLSRFLGLDLMYVAIHNKLLDPALGEMFLQDFHFNFMQTLGFTSFSDTHFVFAAGVVEVLVGALFLLRILPHLSSAILLGVLCTTFILVGPLELVGHLPLFGIALVLLCTKYPEQRLHLWKQRRSMEKLPKPQATASPGVLGEVAPACVGVQGVNGVQEYRFHMVGLGGCIQPGQEPSDS